MSILVKDISKEYKKANSYSLKKLSFEIKQGEAFGLIGDNGSGKSTIIKILMGALKPTTGEVLVNGVKTEGNGFAIRQKMGILYEPERAMYWRLTGVENLMRIAALKGMSTDQARQEIHYYMDMFGIGPDGKKPVATYSKGMKVKLAVIAAFLSNPEILLLDEPLAGLDINAREIVSKLIKDFARKGKTIGLCENNLDVVEKLCDRVLLMQKGTMVAIGRQQELLDEIEGEGVVEIHTSYPEEIRRKIENNKELYSRLNQDEQELKILTDDVLCLIQKLQEWDLNINSLFFRKKNLSDYFIMQGDERNEKNNS